MPTKFSTTDFIKKSNIIHNYVYDYTLVKYESMQSLVKIVCKKHGLFEQTPTVHIHRKSGCPKCGYQQRATTRRKHYVWWSFNEARNFVHSLNLSSIKEWNIFITSEKRPSLLPACPKITYKNQWKGWTDWIGINGRLKSFLSFQECKNIVHPFKLKSYEDWILFCRQGNRPKNIPFAPFEIFEEEWISWGDWLGYSSRANGNDVGFLYIIQQSDLPLNVYKIGRTYRLDKRFYEHQRIHETDIKIIATYQVNNMKLNEELAHKIVKQNGATIFSYKHHKEYFIIPNIQQVLVEYNKLWIKLN